MRLPEKTVERLSVYRRLLRLGRYSDDACVYSHELAAMVSGTAAQVRRDLMAAGVGGHSKRGYRVGDLMRELGAVLDARDGTGVVLVGVGDLGRAILRFVKGCGARLRIVAALDSDPAKVGQLVHGYRCESVSDLEVLVGVGGVDVAIITTPAAAAQEVCDRLVRAGVRGVVNFSPTPIRVPDGVWVERVDLITVLEKVACLVRQAAAEAVEVGA